MGVSNEHVCTLVLAVHARTRPKNRNARLSLGLSASQRIPIQLLIGFAPARSTGLYVRLPTRLGRARLGLDIGARATHGCAAFSQLDWSN